jgi:hypothetical protein
LKICLETLDPRHLVQARPHGLCADRIRQDSRLPRPHSQQVSLVLLFVRQSVLKAYK